MTHLNIEQNRGTRETVASNVVKKLYDLAKEIELDANGTIALKGWLYTSATYLDYITYLENISKVNGEPLLTIDAGKEYISFADPTVLSILSTTYGDGTGVTLSELLNVSNLMSTFKGNTTIETFNEFQYFTGLTNSNIPWSNGDWFNGCTNLREITIPKNLLNMRSNNELCFLGCTSLETVNFVPDTVIECFPVFRFCSSLVNITMPDSVTTIIGNALQGTAITTFDTKNITTLSASVFKLCSSLTSINLPNVTIIGYECFDGDTNLTTVTWDNQKITNINYNAFFNCTSLVINDLNLPNLTRIGSNVFYGTKIKQVSNLGSITQIYYNTFRNCSQLTSVTLPNTCTSIGSSAFRECTSLTTIDLSNVTSIDGDAFNGCTSLGLGQTLELNLTNQTEYPHDGLASSKYTRLILHSPQLLGTYDPRYPLYEGMRLLLYLDLSDWRPAKSTFNNADYGDGSFYGNNSLVTYIAPITVNYIGTMIGALGNYSNFRYLILLSTTPPRLTTTDNNTPPSYWFYEKSGHVDIYVPDSAKAAYLADPDWATIGGYDGSDTIADRLHGLSELPAGVWTTGLASQYLTPALLAIS